MDPGMRFMGLFVGPRYFPSLIRVLEGTGAHTEDLCPVDDPGVDYLRQSVTNTNHRSFLWVCPRFG